MDHLYNNETKNILALKEWLHQHHFCIHCVENLNVKLAVYPMDLSVLTTLDLISLLDSNKIYIPLGPCDKKIIKTDI